MQTETQKPGPGLSGKGCKKHNRKRLSALILDYQKFSQNFKARQGFSNGRCPLDM